MKYRYPWRDGNEPELLIDGGAFFPAMLMAIEEAERSVVLVMYMANPGQCMTRWQAALVAAAARGLEVCVMLDGFGSFPMRGEAAALTDSGVRVGWFNPPAVWPPRANLFRDHRKMLIVDGDVGFIGGFCLVDEFDPACVERPWHEIALRVRGPVVADLLAEFERDWLLYGGAVPGRAHAGDIETGAGEARCRIVRNHPRGRREIRHSVLQRIRQASRRVWLVTPYFAPPRRLRRALRRAAHRGVDVRLLLSGPETDQPLVRSAGWRHYGRLLRAGVRLFEFQDRCLHLKAVLVDDCVSAGSCNLDHWGMRWNRDANFETDDETTVTEFGALFENDFADSDEVTLPAYRRRSAWARLRQRFASWVDVWLVRAAYRKQIRVSRTHPGKPRPNPRR